MRYYALLLILLIVLTGCMSQKFYTSKGVYYPQQPAKELNALSRLNNLIMPDSDNNTHAVGNLISTDNMLYMPVETSYCINQEFHTFSSIYALDKANLTVRDSFVLMKEGSRQSYKHLVWDKDLLAIGKNDTMCIIIRLDKDISIVQEYPTGITVKDIYFAGMQLDKLRLVASDESDNVYMYEFDNVAMNLERKRLLMKGKSDTQNNNEADKPKQSVTNVCSLKPHMQFNLEGSQLWFFMMDEQSIKTTRFDLTALDPSPEFKDFIYPENATGINYYSIYAADSTFYLLYMNQVEDKKSKSGISYIRKLFVVDYNNGKVINTMADLPVVTITKKAGNKTFLYNLQIINARIFHTISECSLTLKDKKELVSFLTDDDRMRYGIGFNYVSFRIFPDGNNLYVTGYYYPKVGPENKKELEAEMAKKGNWSLEPQLYIASYPLK